MTLEPTPTDDVDTYLLTRPDVNVTVDGIMMVPASFDAILSDVGDALSRAHAAEAALESIARSHIAPSVRWAYLQVIAERTRLKVERLEPRLAQWEEAYR